MNNITVIIKDNPKVRLTLTRQECRLKHNYQYDEKDLIKKAQEEYSAYLESDCENTIRGIITCSENGYFRFKVDHKCNKYYTYKKFDL